MGKLHCLFFVVWNLYIFQERGRKGMYEKTKEIYQFLLSQPDYFKEAGKDIDKAVEVFLKKVLLACVKMNMKKSEMNYLQ